MEMLRVLPFVLFLGIWLFALIDCVMTPEREVRNLPKIAWLVVIVLTLVIGALFWLFLGRPSTQLRPGSPARRPAGGTGARPPASRPLGPVGPDDDPDFLRQLGRSNAEHEQLLRDWEQHLKDQEQEQQRKRARKQEREDGRKGGDGKSEPATPDGSDNSDGADGSES
jgi:Phospholipase_D-nuclease N-terminal